MGGDGQGDAESARGFSDRNEDQSPALSTRVEVVLAALRTRPAAWLIAVAGVPGSGKTTCCAELLDHLPHAAVIPMDGYHIPHARLDAEGLRRRGARHTFDDAALRADLARLRETKCGTFPAFDHAQKDPRPDAIRIDRTTEIVIVEGLYLLMRDWRLAPLFDLTIFLDCDLELAIERVAARHLACGLAHSPAAARHRAEFNDRVNALDVLGDGGRERADLVLV